MAKNTVSKKLFAGILALSGAFVLAACDTVNALPKNYEEPIVEAKESLTDNQMGKIWEAIVSGKAEYIHDEIIVQIAENQFGTYFSEGDVAGIADIEDSDDEKIKKFIAAHESVFIREGDDKLAGTGDIYETVRKPRFLAFKADIEQRLAEKLYSEISGGNYVDREGRFCELKMASAHYFSGYTIKGFENGVPEQDDSWNRVYINASIVKDDLSTIDQKVIHVDRFKDYVQRKLIREIYKEKLIEEYVFENKYSTLGRAYGRNVSYVKLGYTDDNKTFAQKILRTYADEYIYKFEAPNMELVANTWRGVENITYDANGQVSAIVAGENINDKIASSFTLTDISTKLAAEFTPSEIENILNAGAEEQLFLDYDYYPESKAGQILERYFKACRAVIDGASHVAATKDQSELDSFTGTNAHSRVKGLKEEFSKLVLEDYTVDEWGLKNGGFSELPSAVRDRLFNINVANAVDNFSGDNAKYIEDSEAHLGRYATSGVYSYVRDIQKVVSEDEKYDYYYLNKADALRYDDDKYSFIFDEDSSYVIVNVKEAASSTKLNIDHEKGYFHTKADPLFTENAAREIAKLLGTKESYKTDAYQHYLEKFNLNFSDQELYDYFVGQYPDLYGEDD